MKIRLMLLVAVAIFALWRVSGVLSSDAVAMGIGLLFGVLAGLPATLLIVAAARRQRQFEAAGFAPADPPQRIDVFVHPVTMQEHADLPEARNVWLVDMEDQR